MYVVILAGGGGTRLWPLSRRARPKPFLPLLGSRTLFQATAARAADLRGPDGRPIGAEGVFVVAEQRHMLLVREQAPSLPAANLLAEPEGRNTAAAIAFAALAIDRPDDEVMVVLPADHFIRDEATFVDVVSAAAATLATGAFGIDDPLVTLGIEPTGPATGYGYLVPGRDPANAGVARRGEWTARLGAREVSIAGHPLAAFVEKPDRDRAEQLIGAGGAYWNAGMFLWRRRAVLAALEAHAPDIVAGVRDALAAGEARGAPDAARYGAVRATSIDYAVMEPAGRAGQVVMGGMNVGWSDVGSWTALRETVQSLAGDASGTGGAGASRTVVLPADDPPPADVDPADADVLVHSTTGRRVVTIGLRDTIVVDTPDAVLVCSADRAQDVRKIVERLAAEGRTEYL